jgi:chemotaxis signal transduction protein
VVLWFLVAAWFDVRVQSTTSYMQIRLLQVGTLTVGLREDEVLKVIDWTTPTPLPFAPNTVLGIVSAQGRMFTVIDLRVLLDSEAQQKSSKQIVALRGAEQLAVAVDDSNSVIEAAETNNNDGASDLFAGSVKVDGRQVLLMNPNTLFAEVIRGRERRRRRL